jgi:flagellar hook-associated protein FlgK
LDSFRIGQSALRANATWLENTAQNIACENVPGYQPSETRFEELPNGGVSAHTIQQPPTQTSGTLDSILTSFMPNDVSLENEMVNMTLSRHAFTAAIRAIQASEECMGAVLDITNNK